MTVPQAQSLIATLQALVDAALAQGKDEIDLVSTAQAMDDEARAALDAAIREA